MLSLLFKQQIEPFLIFTAVGKLCLLFTPEMTFFQMYAQQPLAPSGNCHSVHISLFPLIFLKNSAALARAISAGQPAVVRSRACSGCFVLRWVRNQT